MTLRLASAFGALAVLATRSVAVAAPQVHDITTKGPITVELSSVAVSLVVKKGPAGKARVVADLSGGIGGKPSPDIELQGSSLSIEGLDPTVVGTVTVEVPPGSSVEAETVSGSITTTGVAQVELETVSGDIRVDGVPRVEAQSVSGKLDIKGGARHDLESVSGTIALALGAAGEDARIESVSGEIKLRGVCGKTCRLRLETLSSAATLELDRRSSFAFRFETFSGRLVDKLGLVRNARGGEEEDEDDEKEIQARFGKGEGLIQLETFSGNLTLSPLGK